MAYALEGTAVECSWSALALKNVSSGLSTGASPSTIDWLSWTGCRGFAGCKRFILVRTIIYDR